jgi:hypothetical protein
MTPPRRCCGMSLVEGALGLKPYEEVYRPKGSNSPQDPTECACVGMFANA